jgi:hypothetical protein
MTTPDGKRTAAGPVTWPEVVERIAPLFAKGPGFFATLPDRLASSAPPRYAGAELGGFDIKVAALAILRGPAAAAPLFELASPALPRIIAEIGDTVDRNRAVPAVFTLSYGNVLRCCGAPFPPEEDEAEQKWLPLLAGRARELTEPERHTMAFAACAAARPTLVPAFVDLPGLEEPFVPHRVFGFNVPGFAGYLASAIEHGGSYQDVEPAWLDFVHRFPYKLDTRMLDFPALLFAARAVYATIGGLSESEVALELHRLVTGI